jgi:hypothetical protein
MWGKNETVLGPILLVIALVLVLPVIFFATGLVIAGIYSWLFPEYIDTTNEGSELIELNQ